MQVEHGLPSFEAIVGQDAIPSFIEPLFPGDLGRQPEQLATEFGTFRSQIA